jgi:hypothetical protein
MKVIEQKQSTLINLQNEIHSNRIQIEAYEQEKKSPLTSKLIKEEFEELNRLLDSEQQLKSNYEMVQSEYLKFNSNIEILNNNLNSNLKKRYDEIQQQLMVMNMDDNDSSQSESDDDSSAHEKTFHILKLQIENIDEEIHMFQDELNDIEGELERFA